MPKISMTSCSLLLLPWNEALKIAAEHNFDAFEITFTYPSAEIEYITKKETDEARNISEQYGLEICVHAPFMEHNIAAFSKGIREEALGQIIKAIDFCSDLGGRIVILHSGKYTYAPPQEASEKELLAANYQWQLNIESLKRLNEHALKKRVVLCLENMASEPKSIDRSFEDLLKIQKEVGESLKFTLDIGHARLSEGVEKGIALLGKDIQHIHFTDNFGKKDDHLPIGHGNSDYTPFINFIKQFTEIVTLEVICISTEPEAILKSREYLMRLL